MTFTTEENENLTEYLWSLPVHKRLQHLAKVYKLQQKDIAQKTNTSQNMVWRWFQGIGRPGYKNTKLLSQMFDLPEDIFRNELKPSSVLESVNVLKSTAPDDKKSLVRIFENNNYFLYKMPNSSMETDKSDCISFGDFLFIEKFTPTDIAKDSSFLIGKIVLIKTENCYFLGRLTIQFEEKEYLISPNNTEIYKPFKINDFNQVIGTVRYVLHDIC